MFSQITHDIKFDDTMQMNKTRRKSMMETLESDNIDETLMTDLKSSIDAVIFSDDVNFLIDEIPDEIVSSSTLSKCFQEEDAHKVVVEVFTKEEENHLLEDVVPEGFVEEVATSVVAPVDPPVAPVVPPLVAPIAPPIAPVEPPAVVPEELPVAPPVVPEAALVVAPEDPPVVPEAPPVAPEDPPVVPEDPPVVPEDPPVAPEDPAEDDSPVVPEEPVKDASVEEDTPVAPEDPAVVPAEEELASEGSTFTETSSTEVEQP